MSVVNDKTAELREVKKVLNKDEPVSVQAANKFQKQKPTHNGSHN